MNKQDTYQLLKDKNISYEVVEHEPVYTIEDMDNLGMPHIDKVAKNLFLRDDKGRNYYLVTLSGHKKVDLKTLSELIPSRKLSFANEQRLGEFLGLTPGGVTPFGILNNEQRNVIMVFDSALKGDLIGVHPMENTATVFLKFEDLLKVIKAHDNEIVFCKIP